MTYLEYNNLIKESQHGFRHGRSCLSNLLFFLDKVTRCIDNGDTVDAIYLDFARAFDRVPHERLMQNIKAHGIGGKILACTKGWLSERKQRVCMQAERSSWRDVWSGVPQRSVLSPVLFLIFINDIGVDVISSILKLADDTKVFSEVNNDQDRITR